MINSVLGLNQKELFFIIVISPVSPSSLLKSLKTLFHRDEGDTGDKTFVELLCAPWCLRG